MSIAIPSSIEDKKAIKTALDQISSSLSSIETEKAQVNETLKAIEEKFKLPKKIIRKLAYLHHKQKLTETFTETDELKDLYTKLFK